MNSIRKAARAGALLAIMFVIFAPSLPAYGQTGVIPKDAKGINENYDAIKQTVDRLEQTLKDAIAEGNATKTNGARRNLQFYQKRLAALEKAAIGQAKMAKDSQMVESISNLSKRITDILNRNKVAQPPPPATHSTGVSRGKKRSPGAPPTDRERNQSG